MLDHHAIALGRQASVGAWVHADGTPLTDAELAEMVAEHDAGLAESKSREYMYLAGFLLAGGALGYYALAPAAAALGLPTSPASGAIFGALLAVPVFLAAELTGWIKV